MPLDISEQLRKELYNAVLGDTEAKIDELQRTVGALTKSPLVTAISEVLESRLIN